MHNLAWLYVKLGGSLIPTFHLTNDFEIEPNNSAARAYQYINVDGKMNGEIAPYVVLNANNLFSQQLSFSPKSVIAHGYWEGLSKSAVTLYKKLHNELHFHPIINFKLPK